MICKKCGKQLSPDSISCWSCGFTNAAADESQKRPRWFVWFLYGMIALNIILTMINAGTLLTHEYGVDILLAEANILIFQIMLYAIEILIFTLFLFKRFMKRKVLFGYFVFLILASFIGIFFGNFLMLGKSVIVYFVFQSQWDIFRK